MNLPHYQKYLNVTVSKTQQHASNNLETDPFTFIFRLLVENYVTFLQVRLHTTTMAVELVFGPTIKHNYDIFSFLLWSGFNLNDLTSIGALRGVQKNNLCILVQRLSRSNCLLQILSQCHIVTTNKIKPKRVNYNFHNYS